MGSPQFGTPFFFAEREGFLRNPQSLPRAFSATQNEEVAGATLFFDLCIFPFNKLMSMCLYTKNEPYRTRSSFCVAEREGFEPPEPLSSTVFKTAAIDHSAISPFGKTQSFPEIGCKSTAFFSNIQIFSENSCQYAKNIVILHANLYKYVVTSTQIQDSPCDGDRS